MMISEQNIGLWAERFLNHELNGEEIKALNNALSAHPVLAESWKETIEMMQLLQERQKQNEVKEKINIIREKHRNPAIAPKGKNHSIPLLHVKKYGKIAALAAGLVLVSSLATFWVMHNKTDQAGAQYQLLRREIETIKHSQSRLMDSIKNQDSNEVASMDDNGPVFAGTGFALSNDGYVATDYHVVKDAHAIYVQTEDGKELKAYVFAFEPNSDVAILKIENHDFRFGKKPLPYTFKSAVSDLGQQVFSIGYPQENLVYNEGYISCENGFEGDSASYQLEMVANPGQSGAPVLDHQGNVIAVVTGKQSNTPGKTYAIHSGALLQLMNTLPREAKINLPSANRLRGLSRMQQVDKLREYVCAVKVNY